ncbi:hypothetical protein L1049_011461 [Liquidambar formosana]|uniref:Exocyst subunit Exo70 family protein n=1 Tax=Liquidambar formosana TaxID=63359 RepID=A0AAP0X2W4_LIQFO
MIVPESPKIETLTMPVSKTSPPPARAPLSESMMQENIDAAQSLITKWDPTSSYAKPTSLFLSNRKEARDYIHSVKALRAAMHFYVSKNPTSHNLILAQKLMQIAMKRLEKEFHQILSANRTLHDPSSDSVTVSGRSINFVDESDVVLSDDEESATSDLKEIAECMIMAGYGKECGKLYKVKRKSIVDEALYKLGIERLRSSQVQKMDRVVMEQRIKNWLSAVKVVVRNLFNGERILCDHVFSASDSIRESCFSEITKEGAIHLFRYAEVVAKGKRSTDFIFRLMEMYEAISEIWPETEAIFSFDSTTAVRSQALSSLFKLGDSVRTILSEFEATIQKDSGKTPVPGGGIHSLTRSAMEYISMLADYSPVLSDIVADWPPPEKSQLPESYFDSPTSAESPATAVSVRLAWLILVLLCKLDSKADLYKDVSLSYLFLANNLHFIVEKVRATNLRQILGDEWVNNHRKKVKQYASNYESAAWSKVLSSLPENNSPISPEAAKECFRRFNAAFEEAYKKQTSWVVANGRLRDEMKVSIARKLVNAYREFYESNVVMLSGESNLEGLARIGPDDLGNYLSDLFHGSSASVGSSSSSSSFSSCWSISPSQKGRIQPR